MDRSVSPFHFPTAPTTSHLSAGNSPAINHRKEPPEMTEDQIERTVERVMDALDARFLKGEISEEQYSSEIEALDLWAEENRS